MRLYMNNDLYMKDRYRAPYQYLINANIVEWDISKANISILRQYNKISDTEYKRLYNLPKKERAITIGCMMRDSSDINTTITNGFVEARRLFFETNHIDPRSVLFINKDSITLINIPQQHIQSSFGYINFVMKETYTSFYNLFNIEFLYKNTSNIESYRFKNVDEDKLIAAHSSGMLDMILYIANQAQLLSQKEMVMIIKNLYIQYCSKSLPIQYYREFNNISKYRFKTYGVYTYYSDSYPEDMNIIDISYNAELLRFFYKIFVKEYFHRRR